MRKGFVAGIAMALMLTTLVLVPSPPVNAALRPVQVVTGLGHTCALAPSGQTYCWGLNDNGQLGDNTAVDRLTPVAVQQGTNTFTSIVAGYEHTCGLTSAGATYCWGYNSNGQLGDNSTTSRLTPVAVQQGVATFTSITAGSYYTCGLTAAGAAYCWGSNSYGNLGDNGTTQRLTPVAVQQGAVTFSSITAGYYQTCGLTSAGAAYCWGYNSNGQLGDNSTTDRWTPVAVQQGVVTFSSIAAGSNHSCGLTGAGAAYCWGYNGRGQLGDSGTTQRLTPVAVQQGVVTFASITTGNFHTCGLTAAGVAYCWGWNTRGQLGDNSTTQRTTPVAVGGGLSWSSVTSGANSYNTCGVQLSSQLVFCWGDRANGRLGDNSGFALQRLTPVAVTGGLAFAKVVTGGFYACGLSGAGQSYCWGYNNYGQLGDNTTVDRYSPAAVQQGGPTYSSIVANYDHTCGLTSAGQAYCWGANARGQLGDNSTTTRTAPVAVQQPGGVTFSSLAAGYLHTCGVTSAGATYCWGDNSFGQLGDTTTTQRSTPVAVSQGVTTFSSITAGTYHTCGLTSAGATYCWGYNNHGQLGDTGTTQRNSPVAVSQGVTTFSSITAGYYHTCGLTGAGAAYCWGYNNHGQVGDSGTTQRLAPVAVQQGASTFTSITAGVYHTCAVTNTQRTYCWGYNNAGQLGDNTTSDRTAPVVVASNLGWTAVASSSLSGFTCALVNTSAYCWGYDSYAQLGDWPVGDALLPVQSWFMVTSSPDDLSVSVDPSLTFVVSAHGGTCNGVAQSAGASATSTAVSLGHIGTAANRVGAQDLQVGSNAATGFTVYARDSGAMSDGLGHSVADVAGTNLSPSAFPSAGTEAFGYTTSEAALGTGTPDRFTNGGAKWAAFTTSNAEVSFLSTQGTHTICIAMQTGISSSTPAGSYSTTVIYVVVPSF